MTADDRQMPSDWDALVDREPAARPPSSAGDEPPSPPQLTVMAAAWADLVVLLAVCTGALLGVLLMGERPTLDAFWWATVLAVMWWLFSSTVLVIVRHATPGMLLAGIRFDRPVRRDRLPWVMVVALAGAATLGLPAAIGSAGPLRLAAGCGLVWVDAGR